MDDAALIRFTSSCWSALVVTHRYLGMAMSIPMLVWCLSGFVMIYVHYPRIAESDRLRTLEPISWHACCRFAQAVDDDARIHVAQLEDVAGEPAVLLVRANAANTIGRPCRASSHSMATPPNSACTTQIGSKKRS